MLSILYKISESFEDVQKKHDLLEKERRNKKFKPDEQIEIMEKMIGILRDITSACQNIATVCQECIKFQKSEEKDREAIFLCDKIELDSKKKFEDKLHQRLNEMISTLTEYKKRCEESPATLLHCKDTDEKLRKYEKMLSDSQIKISNSVK